MRNTLMRSEYILQYYDWFQFMSQVTNKNEMCVVSLVNLEKGTNQTNINIMYSSIIIIIIIVTKIMVIT